jgi:hypothetical protein
MPSAAEKPLNQAQVSNGEAKSFSSLVSANKGAIKPLSYLEWDPTLKSLGTLNQLPSQKGQSSVTPQNNLLRLRIMKRDRQRLFIRLRAELLSS